MIEARTAGRLLTCLCAAALASCASITPTELEPSLAERKKLFESRAASLAALERWSMDGKLAISDGEDGGSGRLEWRRQPGLSELAFRGTMGRGAWQLEIQPGHSVLNLANGETWEAPEVSSLIQAHVGWNIPVDALEWWIRGMPEPKGVGVYDFDEGGRIHVLSQHGWTVEYQRYKEFSGLDLPTKIDARNGERRVRFVMRDWTFPESPENG